MNLLYPLKFKPILKSIIWGGDKICSFKEITPQQEGIGESWEISHVEGNVSVVVNGELAGKSLDDLIQQAGVAMIGKTVLERSGTVFPLLIKFIDARDDLSIQVHPDDKLAKARHNSFGKTEMWYVINATPDAKLYSGFKQAITTEEYVTSVENNTFTDKLQEYNVQSGDVFFLPAGRVHAIGSGCFIAEIQQTSNITYRIYDYNRKDSQGNGRELHTALAKDAIDYKVYPEGYKTAYEATKNEVVPLASCRYFTTNLIEGDSKIERDFHSIDSFVIYICMEGSASITDAFGYKVEVKQGESVLVPAACKNRIEIVPFGMCKILETFMQACNQ